MVLSLERPVKADDAPTPKTSTWRTRLRIRERWPGAVVALAYLGAAVAVMGSLWANPSGRTFAANPSDQTWFEWMLVHGLRVFTHGENPLHTSLLNVPTGVNLMVNTNMLALSLTAAPLTALFGPSIVYALLLTLGLAGTAYAWYHVIYHYFFNSHFINSHFINRHFINRHFIHSNFCNRHLVHDRAAAIVGGAICGFGPGIIAHTNGHPNLTMQFLVPLILWRALALRQSMHLWRDGAILAGLVVVQLFINEEVLLDTAIAGTLFVVAYVAMYPAALQPSRSQPSRLQPSRSQQSRSQPSRSQPSQSRSSVLRSAPRMLRGIGVAALIGAVLVAYPIWYQFTGAGMVNGLPAYQHEFPYRLPLISYVTLPAQSLFGSPNLALAHPAEQNSFLGAPMVIVAVAIALVLWRRSPSVRALTVVGLVFAYASLGDRVTVSNPAVSYPYSLWSHLEHAPVFNSVLPTRLALVVLPVVGLLFAHGVAHASGALRTRVRGPVADRGTDRRRLRVRFLERATAPARRPLLRRPLVVRVTAVLGLVAMAGALATIVPRQPVTTAREPVPAFFTDGTWRRYVPAGYSVLTADPVDRVANMRWSIVNDLAFGIPGGYFLGPDTTGVARFGPVPPPTLSLLTSIERGHSYAVTRARIIQAIADIRYWHTAIIVLTPDHPYEAKTFAMLDGLFGPAQDLDGVWIWDVRPLTDGTVATYFGVGGGALGPLPLSLR